MVSIAVHIVFYLVLGLSIGSKPKEELPDRPPDVQWQDELKEAPTEKPAPTTAPTPTAEPGI